MMILTDDKINQIARQVYAALQGASALSLSASREAVLRCLKRVIVAEAQQDVECDVVARKKIASYSRKIVEGSGEWDLIYTKAFDEEMKRRGRASS